MKKKIFTTAAFLLFFMICFAAVAELTGNWTGSFNTPDGNSIAVTYHFKVDGEKLTGTAESPMGSTTIDDGKITGDNFSFKVNVQGQDYPHTGKVYADSCAVDLDLGGAKVHFILKKTDK